LKVIHKKCYDRIPVDIEGTTYFVDSVSRQTFEFAKEIICEGSTNNLFLMNEDDPKSWYTLLPQPHWHETPLYFQMEQISPTTPYRASPDSIRQAGMYLPSEINKFWSSIVSNKQSDIIMQQFSERIIQNLQGSRENNAGMMNDMNSKWGDRGFYLDDFISGDFFMNEYIEKFGIMAYWLTQAGMIFATIMFLNWGFGLLATAYRAAEIHKVLGPATSITKVAVGSLFNVTFLTDLFVAMTATEEEYNNKNADRLSIMENVNEANQARRAITQQPTLTQPPVYSLPPLVMGNRMYPEVRVEPTQYLNANGGNGRPLKNDSGLGEDWV
jgi:hypothetical protein